MPEQIIIDLRPLSLSTISRLCTAIAREWPTSRLVRNDDLAQLVVEVADEILNREQPLSHSN